MAIIIKIFVIFEIIWLQYNRVNNVMRYDDCATHPLIFSSTDMFVVLDTRLSPRIHHPQPLLGIGIQVYFQVLSIP